MLTASWIGQLRHMWVVWASNSGELTYSRNLTHRVIQLRYIPRAFEKWIARIEMLEGLNYYAEMVSSWFSMTGLKGTGTR